MRPTIVEGVRVGNRVYLPGEEEALFEVLKPADLARLQTSGALTGDWPDKTAKPTEPVAEVVPPVANDESNPKVVPPVNDEGQPTAAAINDEAKDESKDDAGAASDNAKPARSKGKPAEAKTEAEAKAASKEEK